MTNNIIIKLQISWFGSVLSRWMSKQTFLTTHTVHLFT